MLEFTIRTLNIQSLRPVERLICLGVLMTLMESSRMEKLSQAWRRQCETMCSDMLYMLNGIEWGEMDRNERNCAAWAVMDIAGVFVPPRVLGPTDLDKTNLGLRLAMKIRQLYGCGYGGLGLDWEHMEAILKEYFWTDGCKSSWKNIWILAEYHLPTEEQVQAI